MSVVSAMDVSELMNDPEMGSRLFTLRRPRLVTDASYANEGELQPAYGESQIRGLVQPATPREVQMLGEGDRVDAVISVWSAEAILCGDGNGREPDVLVIDGEHFKVIKCEPWEQAGYWRAFAERFVP